jgi:hypothetical protein
VLLAVIDAGSGAGTARQFHIHIVGSDGDVADQSRCVQEAYGVSRGDWVLVRPDGYVGAMFSSREAASLEGYMAHVGLSGSDATRR